MKQPSEMNLEEAEREVESLEHYFASCKRYGNGVSSKDTMRHRRLLERVRVLRIARG